MVAALRAGNNSRTQSGSLYVIYNTLIDDYSGTGNNIDLATSTNYNLRYDGATASDQFAGYGAAESADLDNDGKQDIMVGAQGADNNSRSGSGSLWIIYNTLIDDYSGTGNNIDLATSTNYNLRYDGQAASNQLTYGGVNAVDFFGTGKNDIVVSANKTANNSRTDSGSVYVIANSLIDDYSGTGNNIDLNTAANSTLRYDGAVASDRTVTVQNGASDIDGDGSLDLAMVSYMTDNNSRTDSGSVYIIYNFPHAFSVNSVSTPRTTIPTSITGTLSASNSTTTIGGLAYSHDNTSYSGSWSSCSADDGTFNSTSESFTCTISGGTVSDGSHYISLRAYDSNTSYNQGTGLGSSDFVIDISNPSGEWTGSNGDKVTFTSNSPGNNSYTDDELPTFIFTKSRDPVSTISKYQIILTNDKEGSDSWNNHIYIDNIDPNPSSGTDGQGKANSNTDKDRTREDDSRYIYYKDYQITVRSKKLTDKLTSGSYKWKVRALDLTDHSIDTGERILRVKTKNSFFSKKDTNFPLSIQSLGNLSNLNLASFNQANIQPNYNISTTTPNIQGITYSGATVKLTLTNTKTNKTITKQTTAKNSIYTINLTKEDNLIPNTIYTLNISSELNDNYVELPEFKLTVGKSQIQQIQIQQTQQIQGISSTVQPTPIPTPLPTTQITQITQTEQQSISNSKFCILFFCF